VQDHADGIDVRTSTGNKISIDQVRSNNNNNVGLVDSNGDNRPNYGSGMDHRERFGGK
jgi:hypothetical protein